VEMNKRAQMFTLISIALISFMFLSFEIYTFIQEKNSIKSRVDSMNSFLDSIEENLERQLYIAGFRIIFLAEADITTSGLYVDVDDFFNEAFFSGTVHGVANSTYLTGVTYDDLVESVNEDSAKINVEIILTNTVINISQDDPWNIRFDMVSDFVMVDREGLANWTKQQVLTAYIPVVGFEDPFYTINSNARVSRKISETIFEGNYVSGSDIGNLSNHFVNGFYAASTSAPNFLMRLEGNFSADLDGNGIESFVDVTEFSAQGLTTYSKSVIDYIYFSGSNPSHSAVSGMPEGFRIDDESGHHAKYNVSGVVI
jgi:hypothetical protein